MYVIYLFLTESSNAIIDTVIKMKIKKVGILGAGAVGSYMIWGLSQKKDIELYVIADGKRAKRLESGILINDEMYHPNVVSSCKLDLLIVCLKYGALKDALDTISDCVSQHTIVMSLMNGVDSEEIIGEKIGISHMLYSLIKVASHKEQDGFYFDPETTIGIVYGGKEEYVLAIDELFENTPLHYRKTDCILEEIWSKFRLNVCNNLPQAILGAGVGCYRDSKHMQAIRQGLQSELEAIAKAKGIDLNKAATSSFHGSIVPPKARYSTLQDLDAKRHTEIDMFSGALMRMGKELGIPTPYNEYTYHMIKALEEKNDGLFEYDNVDEKTSAS